MLKLQEAKLKEYCSVKRRHVPLKRIVKVRKIHWQCACGHLDLEISSVVWYSLE